MRFSFIHSHIITNITNIMEVVWLGHRMGSIKKVIKNRSKNYKRVNYKVDKQ